MTTTRIQTSGPGMPLPADETSARDLADSRTDAPTTDRIEQTEGVGPTEPVEAVERSPGPVALDPALDLWPEQATDGLRERWRELQLRFVDDPKAAVTEADAVLAETIEILNGSLAAARADLSQRSEKQDTDTEALRVTVQHYRAVLDRVLAL